MVEMDYRIVQTIYDTEDYIVAAVVATEAPYFLDNTGSTDITESLKWALYDCEKAGGGVVYLPAGFYRLDGCVTIPSNVTLRGDFCPPEKLNKGNPGTVISIMRKPSDEAFPASFCLNGSSGIRGLTIWYPEQTLEYVKPYPYAIELPIPNKQELPFIQSMQQTICEIHLLNAYRGIAGSLRNEESPHELHFLDRIYGSPLHIGCHIQNCSDTGRSQHIYFDSSYWANAGELFHAPKQELLIQYMQENTSGVVYGDSEWEEIFDFRIADCKYGLVITQGPRVGPILEVYGVKVDNCIYPLVVTDVDERCGIEFADCSFCTTGEKNTVALSVSEYRGGSALFNRCRFDAGEGSLVQLKEHCKLVFEHCYFDSFLGCAITVNAGMLSLNGCAFSAALDKNHVAIRADKAARGVYIDANRYVGDAEYFLQAQCSAIIGKNLYEDYPRGRYFEYKFYDQKIRPRQKTLYCIDAPKDNTDASREIQRALNELETAGGGIAFLPAGMYRIERPLTVPAGVELRGVDDVPHQGTKNGTILCIRWGKNIESPESATAAITLKSGAGIRGIKVFYPEFILPPEIPKEEYLDYPWTIDRNRREHYFKDFDQYPYAIRGDGEDIYIVFVTLINASRGIDLSGRFSQPCERHYVRYVNMFAMECGIFVGNCKEGWLENNNYQVNNWCRSEYKHRCKSGPDSVHMRYQQFHCSMIKIGSCQREYIRNNAMYGARVAYHFVEQDGKGPHAILINVPADGVANNILVEATDSKGISITNTVLCVLVDATDHNNGIEVLKGNVSVRNAQALGFNVGGMRREHGENVYVTDGRLVLEGASFWNRGVKLMGGETALSGVILKEKTGSVTCKGGKTFLNLIQNE